MNTSHPQQTLHDHDSGYLAEYEDETWQAQEIDSWGNEWDSDDAEPDFDLYYN